MGSKHCVAFQWRKYYQDFYFPDPDHQNLTPTLKTQLLTPKTRPRPINSLFERLADIETLLGVVIKRCSIHPILILCHSSYKKLYSRHYDIILMKTWYIDIALLNRSKDFHKPCIAGYYKKLYLVLWYDIINLITSYKRLKLTFTNFSLISHQVSFSVDSWSWCVI